MSWEVNIKRKKNIQVFLASPGDLKPERQAFRLEIARLNHEMADLDERVEIVPIVWEDTLTPTGGRVQESLDRRVAECDVFILTLYRRWGQAAPDSRYSSYCEEEFHQALKRLAATDEPDIHVFCKEIEPSTRESPDQDLARVLAFQRELDRTRTTLCRHFNDEGKFRELVAAAVRGRLEQRTRPTILPERFPLRMELIEREAELLSKPVDPAMLDLARQAAQDFREGNTEEARQAFDRVVRGTTDGEALFLAFEFYRSIEGGEASAEDIVSSVLARCDPDSDNLDTAAALAQLANIYHWYYHNLEQAERLQRKSLAINQKIGASTGVADQHTRLGILLAETNWTAAEIEFETAIEESRRHDRPRGVAYALRSRAMARRKARGDETEELDKSEIDLLDALKINRRREEPWAIAVVQEALGDLYDARNQIEKARVAYRDAALHYAKVNNQLGVGTCLAALEALD